MTVLDNHVTEIEKIQLYRESYLAGQGRVNVKSFLVAANETGLFMRISKVKTSDQYKQFLASRESSDSSAVDLGRVELNRLQIQNNVIEVAGPLNDAFLQMGYLGVEVIMNQFMRNNMYFSFAQPCSYQQPQFSSHLISYFQLALFIQQNNLLLL